MKKIFSNLFSALKKVGGAVESQNAVSIQEDDNSVTQKTAEKPVDIEGEVALPEANCEDLPSLETDPLILARCEKWLIALGGSENILSVSSCAATRLRIKLRNKDWLDREELINTGARGVMICDGEIIHIVIGFDVGQYELAMQKLLAE